MLWNDEPAVRVVQGIVAQEGTAAPAGPLAPVVLGANRGARGFRRLLSSGAADRIRTGDVQLGKLAFCH
jgi:hypothetical protein